MKKKKLRIGILFGGRSGEHEVSLLSAASILKAIDRKKYDVVPIGITKEGRWVTAAEAQQLLTGQPELAPKHLEIPEDDPEFAISAAVLRSGEPLNIPPPTLHTPQTLQQSPSADISLTEQTKSLGVDVI